MSSCFYDTMSLSSIDWDLNYKILGSAPWMDHGGNYNNSTIAGVFNFSRNPGQGNTASSFRSVLSWINYGLKIVKKHFFKTQSRGS